MIGLDHDNTYEQFASAASAVDSPASPHMLLKDELQLCRVESPTCTPTIAMSAREWHSQRECTEALESSKGLGSTPASLPEESHRLVEPGSTSSAPAESEGWVPLSVRHAQAREKAQEETRRKKMAQVVAPVILDAVTGLPCIPERCLPIKQYQRWLDASKVRAQAVERRRQAARSEANKVMMSLAAKSVPRIYDHYVKELADVRALKSLPSARHSCGAEQASQQDPTSCREHDAQDAPPPMLKRCNSWELFAKLGGGDSCDAAVAEMKQ